MPDPDFPTFYVNRNPNNRKRHLDPRCRGVKLGKEYLQRMHQDGLYEGFEAQYGQKPPTVRSRFVTVTPMDADEMRALEAFTIPCMLCNPEARALAAKSPVTFEERYTG